MTEPMENPSHYACQVPPDRYVPLFSNQDGFTGHPSLGEPWMLGADRVSQVPLDEFNSSLMARNGQWALPNSSENANGVINTGGFDYKDSWVRNESGGNWLSHGSLSHQPDPNFAPMSHGPLEPPVSNYLPVNLAYTPPELCGNTTSVVMGSHTINGASILDSSIPPITVGNNEIPRSCDPYSHLQTYPTFHASNDAYQQTGAWSGQNPTVSYFPRETIIFCPHATSSFPSDGFDGPGLEPEPRMLRCEWEGTCGVSITFDQASISRHIKTHIAEELAKAISGAAGTTSDGKAKVRYVFDPTRSWLPSGITFEDIEVGARVRMVMEKGKVWARCLWGAKGACAYCRTAAGEKDKGELTLEYLPRHIWGIHFGTGTRFGN